MDIKEVIQYIAEEDLEINLTLQVGSEADDNLKEEVRQLRKRIDELQMNGDASLPDPETEDLNIEGTVSADESKIEPDGPAQTPEEYYSDESDEEEDTEVESKTGEDEKIEVSEDTESSDEEPGDDGSEEDDQFEEMFGEEEPEDPAPEPPEEEPTEEERSEAGADFEDLFGEV